jgi:hypothetical protein
MPTGDPEMGLLVTEMRHGSGSNGLCLAIAGRKLGDRPGPRVYLQGLGRNSALAARGPNAVLVKSLLGRQPPTLAHRSGGDNVSAELLSAEAREEKTRTSSDLKHTQASGLARSELVPREQIS